MRTDQPLLSDYYTKFLRMESLAAVLEADLQRNQRTMLRAAETLRRLSEQNGPPGRPRRTRTTIQRLQDLILLKRKLLDQLRTVMRQTRGDEFATKEPEQLAEAAAQQAVADIRTDMQKRQATQHQDPSSADDQKPAAGQPDIQETTEP